MHKLAFSNITLISRRVNREVSTTLMHLIALLENQPCQLSLEKETASLVPNTNLPILDKKPIARSL